MAEAAGGTRGAGAPSLCHRDSHLAASAARRADGAPGQLLFVTGCNWLPGLLRFGPAVGPTDPAAHGLTDPISPCLPRLLLRPGLFFEMESLNFRRQMTDDVERQVSIYEAIVLVVEKTLKDCSALRVDRDHVWSFKGHWTNSEWASRMPFLTRLLTAKARLSKRF